jgi:hypothetical protein
VKLYPRNMQATYAALRHIAQCTPARTRQTVQALRTLIVTHSHVHDSLTCQTSTRFRAQAMVQRRRFASTSLRASHTTFQNSVRTRHSIVSTAAAVSVNTPHSQRRKFSSANKPDKTDVESKDSDWESAPPTGVDSRGDIDASSSKEGSNSKVPGVLLDDDIDSEVAWKHTTSNAQKETKDNQDRLSGDDYVPLEEQLNRIHLDDAVAESHLGVEADHTWWYDLVTFEASSSAGGLFNSIRLNFIEHVLSKYVSHPERWETAESFLEGCKDAYTNVVDLMSRQEWEELEYCVSPALLDRIHAFSNDDTMTGIQVHNVKASLANIMFAPARVSSWRQRLRDDDDGLEFDSSGRHMWVAFDVVLESDHTVYFAKNQYWARHIRKERDSTHPALFWRNRLCNAVHVPARAIEDELLVDSSSESDATTSTYETTTSDSESQQYDSSSGSGSGSETDDASAFPGHTEQFERRATTVALTIEGIMCHNWNWRNALTNGPAPDPAEDGPHSRYGPLEFRITNWQLVKGSPTVSDDVSNALRRKSRRR